jgi:hypothetical protein
MLIVSRLPKNSVQWNLSKTGFALFLDVRMCARSAVRVELGQKEPEDRSRPQRCRDWMPELRAIICQLLCG